MQAIPAVGHRPAVFDHPAAEILAVQLTSSHRAPVAVLPAYVARDRCPTDLIGKRKSRVAPAVPLAPIRQGAALTALYRVHGTKTNAGSMDFDCVTVDHGSGAGQRLGLKRRGDEHRAHYKPRNGLQWQWTVPTRLSMWQHCPGGELFRQPPPCSTTLTPESLEKVMPDAGRTSTQIKRRRASILVIQLSICIGRLSTADDRSSRKHMVEERLFDAPRNASSRIRNSLDRSKTSPPRYCANTSRLGFQWPSAATA